MAEDKKKISLKRVNKDKSPNAQVSLIEYVPHKKPLSQGLNTLIGYSEESYKVQNRLKVILASKDISQIELAEAIGISKSTLSNIINNYQNATLETALDIAHVLNMSVNDIFYKIYDNDIYAEDNFMKMLDNMKEVYKLYSNGVLDDEQIKMIYRKYVEGYKSKHGCSEFGTYVSMYIEEFKNNRFALDILLSD